MSFPPPRKIRIVASAPQNQVIAKTGVDKVVTSTAIDRIVAPNSVDLIVPVATIDVISLETPVNHVVAILAQESVDTLTTKDDIIAHRDRKV